MRILPFICLLFLLDAGCIHASEPAQALLNELTRSHSASGHRKADTSVQSDPGTVLFTLEDLKDSGNLVPDLVLPEDSPAEDIPLAMNEKVEYFVSYFQTRGRSTFSRWLSRSTRYLPMMKEILRKEGLPDELVYVAMIESGFQLHARSHANAVGPWQFMSATGRRYSLRIDQWVDERRDPVKATVAAAMYLKDLYSMFNNDWYLAAAGYNAGENKIFRAIGKYDTVDFWEISKGSYLKRETKEYVPKLLAAAIIAKDPARYGFTEIASVPIIEYDTVSVTGQIDLELVARLTGTTHQSIRELNPSLLHWCTPPNYPEFELKLPKSTKGRFEQGIAAIPEAQRHSEKVVYSRYRASKKETLAHIAKRFGSTPAELSELNGLKHTSKIAGRNLIVPAGRSVAAPVTVASATSVDTSADVTYYTVRKGDTLHSLARRFNVSAKILAAWNNLKGVVALKPGKRLIIAKAGEVTTPRG